MKIILHSAPVNGSIKVSLAILNVLLMLKNPKKTEKNEMKTKNSFIY